MGPFGIIADVSDEDKNVVFRKVSEGKQNFNIFEYIFSIKMLIDRMWSFVIVIANTRLKELHDLNIDTTYEDCLNYAVHQAFNKLSSEARPYVEYILNISIQNDVLSRKENVDVDRGNICNPISVQIWTCSSFLVEGGQVCLIQRVQGVFLKSLKRIFGASSCMR